MASEHAADVAPCRTLYVRNLPERLPKAKLVELLHAAFSPYGAVLWISAQKTRQLRGQAFVTFADMAAATAALRKMHGAAFLGNVVEVQYAKAVSDRGAAAAAAVQDGSGPKKKVIKELKDKRRRLLQRDDEQGSKRLQQEHPPNGDADGGPAAAGLQMPAAGMPDADDDVVMDPQSARAEAAAQQQQQQQPNKILFAERLPEDDNPEGAAAALSDLFARFAGFVEVRAVPGKRDIAFIEFTSEDNAAVALSGLQGYMLGNPAKALVLSFAKR